MYVITFNNGKKETVGNWISLVYELIKHSDVYEIATWAKKVKSGSIYLASDLTITFNTFTMNGLHMMPFFRIFRYFPAL